MSFVPPRRPPARRLLSNAGPWHRCRVVMWSLAWAAIGAWMVGGGAGRWPG